MTYFKTGDKVQYNGNTWTIERIGTATETTPQFRLVRKIDYVGQSRIYVSLEQLGGIKTDRTSTR